MTKATMRLSVALLACLLLALPVAAKDIARVSVSAGELVFTPEAAVAGFQLTVTGPGGYLYTETFDGSGAMTWAAQAADGGLLANGAYRYELRPITHQVERGSVADLELGKPELTALSGTVTVRGGSLVSPDQREEPLTKDQVIADDAIITGSLCVGFDCVNNENFGFDTIRLKENNTRIKFQDTSTGTFPSNDWQLTANDSASGGANKFSIDDIDGGRTPFTIEAGAPSNSLYVDDAGNLGLGTSTPVVEIHVKDGDSPALRLEQDGSSGFTPQTWDVAGNETNFFVRDVTNGSKLPFKIFPNAPTNSLTIKGSTGDIGVGTQAPATNLHIKGKDDADDHAELILETAVSGQQWMWRANNASGEMNVIDNTGTVTTPLKIAPDSVTNLLRLGDGALDRVTVNGALVITGNCSDGDGGGGGVDGCDRVFRPDYPLPSIEEHASLMWENKYLPAVGPTPEDAPWDLGRKAAGILNELEKAHIYIEQLHQRLEAKDAVLADIQERLKDLEESQGN